MKNFALVILLFCLTGCYPERPRAERRPVETTAWKVGDTVKAAAGIYYAYGTIVDGPFISGQVDVLFISNNGSVSKVTVPVSVLTLIP